MRDNPGWFTRKGRRKDFVANVLDSDLARFPVENVDRADIEEFLTRLNQLQAMDGWPYRLPSCAEWEYACRGALTSKSDCDFDFYFATPTNSVKKTDANTDRGRGRGPKAAGSYPSNMLGLFDMHGNIEEWCDEQFDEGTDLIARGGSWLDDEHNCRAGSVYWYAPDDGTYVLGFRLILSKAT